MIYKAIKYAMIFDWNNKNNTNIVLSTMYYALDTEFDRILEQSILIIIQHSIEYIQFMFWVYALFYKKITVSKRNVFFQEYRFS